MQLVVEQLSHTYADADQLILNGVSFTVEKGEIACLLGPSGSGKTTILRCIAGFEYPDAGCVKALEIVLSSPETHVPPAKRNIGMMFQDYALLPHLNVTQNITFGLHKLDKLARSQRVTELLEVVGLSEHAEKYPHQLSGGQQQRVALARAIAPNPSLILMDEPFSNLDVELRERLGQDIRAALKHYGITALMVTHDQHEAFALADKIGVLRRGVLQQWDTAYNLYHKPINRFVADFVGQGTFVTGKMNASGQVEIELGELEGELLYPVEQSKPFDVLLRPDDVIHDDDSTLQAEVLKKAFRGADILYTLGLPSGEKVLSLVPSHHNHAIGEAIGIKLETDHVVAFAKE